MVGGAKSGKSHRGNPCNLAIGALFYLGLHQIRAVLTVFIICLNGTTLRMVQKMIFAVGLSALFIIQNRLGYVL